MTALLALAVSDDDGLDGYEIAVESCDYCDAGWVESAPVPTPDGPHYSYSRCRYCDGGKVTVERLPITLEDLDEYCGDWS